MEDRERRAVVLALAAALDKNRSWCGETHVQKSTYFLQELLNVPLGFGFIFYKHGPFSFDLRDEITGMVADDILRIQPQPAPYGPSILPGKWADRQAQRFASTVNEFRTQIDFVARNLGQRGMGVAELERLATALYVWRRPTVGESVESRVAEIRTLKPHITEEQAKDAVQRVDVLIRESAAVLTQAQRSHCCE